MPENNYIVLWRTEYIMLTRSVMTRIFYVFWVIMMFQISCSDRRDLSGDQDSSYLSEQIADFDRAPMFSPEESIGKMIIEDGFEISLVASEPEVSSPVALNFDDLNRMWVVEMEGYMTDADGTEENQKSGKIVILEDVDGDGLIDKRKVFLDSLVLPRAICLVDNGVLVAEPPRLWFVEIENDKPGKKILIDEAYTEGGNVEAQANGLFRAMDNWIYSGGSEKRYRKQGDKWLTERTHLRGQWGITQDDYGRLYYNNNSQNLLGDFFPPALGASNANMRRVKGFNERIISDNRVYPARPTPGVNRGYKADVLDSTKRLLNFTAACGPALYRGDLFDKEYYNNVFVAEPAANLIKRNILEEHGFTSSGRQAYQGREFLASLDERFRPVSLYNGPDGALYVVDMYRGIIQHKSFLTDYLRNEIEQRSLDKPVNCGRIYRVIPKGKAAEVIKMPTDPLKLADMLKHPNGWIRDKAQQIVVDHQYRQAIPRSRQLMREHPASLAGIQAMWTLEGLGALQSADVMLLLNYPDWKVRAQTLSALPAVVNNKNYRDYIHVFRQLISQTDTLTAPYLAFRISSLQRFDKEATNDMLRLVSQKYPANAYVADALITNLYGREVAFYKDELAKTADTNTMFYARLIKVISDIKDNEVNGDANHIRKQFPRGASLFRSACQSCHGTDGNGISSLAPPLNRSEWVTGRKDQLIAIVLYGLSGPVRVNNKIYKSPEINGDMPGIGSNKDIVDEDIAQLLSFLRNSWNNRAEKISREEVIQIRRKFGDRKEAFVVSEEGKLF